jgi:hypothetical protein
MTIASTGRHSRKCRPSVATEDATISARGKAIFLISCALARNAPGDSDSALFNHCHGNRPASRNTKYPSIPTFRIALNAIQYVTAYTIGLSSDHA